MANWLDKYEPGGNVAKTDATRTNKPAPQKLMTEEQKKRAARREQAQRAHDAKELAKKVAKNQTYLSADNTTPELRAAYREAANTENFINNAPLTQSLAAMSPNDNPMIGRLAAQTITEANPIMSAVRLTNSLKDPANNAYGIGSDAGVLTNAIGTLGLVGDLGDFGNMFNPAAKYITTNTPLANAYKLNPWATKIDDAASKIVGEGNSSFIYDPSKNRFDRIYEAKPNFLTGYRKINDASNLDFTPIIEPRTQEYKKQALEQFKTLRGGKGEDIDLSQFVDYVKAQDERRYLTYKYQHFLDGLNTEKFFNQYKNRVPIARPDSGEQVNTLFTDIEKTLEQPNTPLGKKLGEGAEGSVYELVGDPNNVIKIGQTFKTTNADDLVKSFEGITDDNIARVTRAYKDGNYLIEVMPNLNANPKFSNFTREQVLDKLEKDARTLMDKGFYLDVKNASGNFRYNPEKNKVDIYDVSKPAAGQHSQNQDRIVEMLREHFNNNFRIPSGNHPLYDPNLPTPEFKNGGWLEKYNDGGPVQENYNNASTSFPPNFVGAGYDTTGRNYSPAWGGQFQMGGSMPGAVGFTYARTNDPAPSNGPYAKKTEASAQNGTWLDKGINKLYDAEDNITKWLGNPMQRAANTAKEASYKHLGSMDDPIDSYRHSMAGNYTSKAIQDKLYNIPLISQAAGFIGANVLGAGHEISTLIGHAPEFGGDDDRPWLDKIRESGEDAFNNMVGAGVGSMPFMSAKQKANTLLNLSLNNRLPDGHGQGNMYIKKKQNGGEMKYYQDGLDFKPKSISKNGKKIIKDDRGQWAHPGKVTKIGSNQITMQGVPYPVLGISDTGDMQMMYPNQDYTYHGSSVTEYPMMKEGGALQLTKLDQLTNFTNYNTKQPGGWLDKYQD